MRSGISSSPASGRRRRSFGKFDRASLGNQSGRGGFFEIKPQPGEIFLVKIEVDVVREVSLERERRKIELDCSALGDFAQSGEPVALREFEIGGHFRSDRL